MASHTFTSMQKCTQTRWPAESPSPGCCFSLLRNTNYQAQPSVTLWTYWPCGKADPWIILMHLAEPFPPEDQLSDSLCLAVFWRHFPSIQIPLPPYTCIWEKRSTDRYLSSLDKYMTFPSRSVQYVHYACHSAVALCKCASLFPGVDLCKREA